MRFLLFHEDVILLVRQFSISEGKLNLSEYVLFEDVNSYKDQPKGRLGRNNGFLIDQYPSL